MTENIEDLINEAKNEDVTNGNVSRGQLAIERVKCGDIEIYRDLNKYYYRVPELNEFVCYTEDQVKKKIIRCGISNAKEDSELYSPFEDVIEYIQDYRNVSNIVPCCPGVKVGFHKTDKSYLVLKDYERPVMVKGNHSTLDEYFDSAFGDNKHYLFGYLKNTLNGLVNAERVKGHHLVVAGNAGKGKSYLGAVLSFLTGFGGNMCGDSIEFVKGVKDNCKSAFYNPWLVNDDMGLGGFNRNVYIERLKNINYSDSMTLRALYGDTINLRSCHRTLQFVNLSENALKSVPCMDNSFDGKLILLKMNDDTVMPYADLGSRDGERNKLMSDEYKAFAHYLYNEYEIPEEFKAPKNDPRGLVKGFIDSDVMELVQGQLPDNVLIEVMVTGLHEGLFSTTEIHNVLVHNSAYQSLNLSPVTLGRMLTRIFENPSILNGFGFTIDRKKHSGTNKFNWSKVVNKVVTFEGLFNEAV